MADETASFGIELELEGGADVKDTASALAELRSRIEADTKSLRAMSQAMRQMKAGGKEGSDTFKNLQERITAQKASLASAQAGYLKLGGNFQETSIRATRTGASFGDLSSAAQQAGGPIGGLVGRLTAMKGLLAAGVMAGALLAIAAAFAAMTAAVVAATAALTKYGIAQAGARRSELLRLEGLSKIRNWYGLAADSAEHLQGAIDDVSGKTALGRGALERYAGQLQKLHLRGENFKQALEGVAIIAATQGDEQANIFAQWAASANRAGGDVKALADDVRARLGGVAKRQLLDLGVQSEKLRENLARIFDGLKIETLLEGVHSIVDLFSQSNVEGQALKTLAEVVFQPLIDAVTFLAPFVKRFIQGMIIGFQQVVIGVLEVAVGFKKAFGDHPALLKFKELFESHFNDPVSVGIVVARAVASAVLVTVGAIAALAAAGAAAGAALAKVWDTIKRLEEFFNEKTGASLGKSLTDGIVNALGPGAQAVANAMGGLGKTALAALKSVWRSASPSKAFEDVGHTATQGLTRAARSGEGDVVSAFGRLGGAALDGAQAPQGGGRSTTIEIGGITVTAPESGDPKDFAEAIGLELQRRLEGANVTLGAA